MKVLFRVKTVVLASNQDIINNGHINADKVGLQSDTTIYQQGQIVGRDAVGLQAKENITFNNSIEHLTNQDVLHKTAGIAISGDTGVMIVSAGNDVNLGGATIEALGKEGLSLLPLDMILIVLQIFLLLKRYDSRWG